MLKIGQFALSVVVGKGDPLDRIQMNKDVLQGLEQVLIPVQHTESVSSILV